MVVLVVSIWSLPHPLVDLPLGAPPVRVAERVARETRTMVGHLVDALVGDPSTVHVRQRIVQGDAGAELVRLSEHAALMVVGARGHGDLAGTLLGSVSRHVLAHSRSTVVVVR
jgi:nucleotide-binding universal stress UspA family protein